MLSKTACISKVCLETYIFIIISVNIDEKPITKINEITPVSCRRKFDFNDLWDPVP